PASIVRGSRGDRFAWRLCGARWEIGNSSGERSMIAFGRMAAVAALGVCLTIPAARRAAVNHASHRDAGSAVRDTTTFMTVDAAAKKVSLRLYAAYGSENGGMNFNGGSRGNQTITIPLGWTVHIDFQNKDA